MEVSRLTPEVLRMLSYMASFARYESRTRVAVLMDRIAVAPSIGAVVTAKREVYGVEFPTAILAFSAVEYAEAYTPGMKMPKWMEQAGVTPLDDFQEVTPVLD